MLTIYECNKIISEALDLKRKGYLDEAEKKIISAISEKEIPKTQIGYIQKSLAKINYSKCDFKNAFDCYLIAITAFLSVNNKNEADECLVQLATCTELFRKSSYFYSHFNAVSGIAPTDRTLARQVPLLLKQGRKLWMENERQK